MEGSPFLPLSDGLHIERVTASANELLVYVISSSPKVCCPLCSVQASRIHSRYIRRVADLPCAGRRVTLLLTVHKWEYAAAARKGAPQAQQVADRFHLLLNLAGWPQKAHATQASLFA